MRFGMSWRPEIGSGILRHLDEIDVVEIIAEQFATADRATRRALRFLGAQVPVVVHATSLGLASTEGVDRKRLDRVARVVGWIEPRFWSEHLAFVRAGGTEIGHLAAPPRNDATLEGLVRNVRIAERVIGSRPMLENVATLVEPPFSAYDEAGWLNAVTNQTGSKLLLDLHNLHANATNFGFDAREVVRCIPHDRIGAIHIAGGRRIERDRVLDDHLHRVSPAVYELLGHVDTDAVVILERDGEYPEFAELLEEVRAARAAARRVAHRPAAAHPTSPQRGDSPPRTLPFLAALYTNATTLSRFMQRPVEEAVRAGFSMEEAQTIAAMNTDDLRLAARSFAKKRGETAKSQSV